MAITDNRSQALAQWLETIVGQAVEMTPASTDASFRRYFRVQMNGRSVIAMDAPPEQENNEAFIDVASRLSVAGLTVPEILAEDLEQGFLLLSDLGLNTYLHVLNAENADLLFDGAVNTLLTMQANADVEGLPCYDEKLLRRDFELFPKYYLQQHLGLSLPAAIRRQLDQFFDQLVSHILAQPQVFVHRDFMPRNLMISSSSDTNKNPGVLDFQDAVFGPVSYDISCLFKDAFISWPEDKITQWLRLYWRQALLKKIPVAKSFAAFQRDCDLMAVQRHLKVIGIFARICHRDGKPQYVDDVPRFFNYLRTAIARQPELILLGNIFNQIDGLPQ